MSTSQNIMIIIGLSLLVVFLTLLIWYVVPLFIKRKRETAQLNKKYYPVASAGNYKKTLPAKEESVSVSLNKFYDKNGCKINPDEYLQFVVSGDSMKFCGIHDKDLLFVAKDFRIVQLKKFPYILVIRRSNFKPGETEYKVRRAWASAHYDNDEFRNILNQILESSDFKEVKQLKDEVGKPVYPGDNVIIEDFIYNRLPKYKERYIDCNDFDEWNKTVVISTTYDTDKRYIHFSIHPIADIVGIVKESFTVK